MIDLEREQLERDPAWRVVLEAYWALQAETAEQSESHGWVTRVSDLEGIPSERLSVLHGRLIALGLLKFELAGRTEGLRYQLSMAGKQFLNRAEQASNRSDDGEGDEDEPTNLADDREASTSATETGSQPLE